MKRTIQKYLMEYVLLFSILTSGYIASASTLDSLLQVELRGKSLQEKIEYFNDVSWEYYYSDLDSMLHYANVAQALNQDVDRKELAITYTNKGVYYEVSGNSNKAIEFYHKAVTIQEEISDSSGLAFTFTNLGWFYHFQYDYEHSNEYFQQSLKLNILLGDSLSMANNLISIGVNHTYIDTVDFTIPEQNYTRAVAIYKKFHNDYYLGSAYVNFAKIYIKSNPNLALDYYRKAEDLAIKNKDTQTLWTIAFSKAVLHQNQGEYANSLKDLRHSTKLKLDFGANQDLQYDYDMYASIFSSLNQYDSALYYYKKSKVIKDSIFQLATNEKVAEMEVKYETEKKDKEIAQFNLSLKEELEKNHTANQNIKMLSIGLGIFLLLIAGGIYLYVQKLKNNKALNQKNAIIYQNLNEKEVLLGEIHHRVKNNLQLVSTMLQLQSNASGNEDFSKLIQESRGRIQSMALIHQLLYEHDDLSGVEMKTYLEKLVLKLDASYGYHETQTKFDVDTIKLNIDTAIPIALVVNELYTNSIKYAFENVQTPTVQIVLKDEKEFLQLIVSDNGNGYDIGNTPKNFGSKLIKSFSRQLKATVTTVSNNLGTKTELIITRYEIN